jgi:hypothetical protein
MDTDKHWEDQKLPGSEKDTASVEVTELERNQSVSPEQEDFLISDYAQDVAVKVGAVKLWGILLLSSSSHLTGAIYARRSVTAGFDFSVLVPRSWSQRIRKCVGTDILVTFPVAPRHRTELITQLIYSFKPQTVKYVQFRIYKYL